MLLTISMRGQGFSYGDGRIEVVSVALLSWSG